LARLILIALTLAAGCYDPALHDCRLQCGPSSACPSGLTCDTGWCRLPVATRQISQCPADGGAPPDSDIPSAVDPGGDVSHSGDMSDSCAVVYVAPSGRDDASGCAPATPKLTIGAALTAVGELPREVHVCKGTYAESGLSVAYVLRGGYDCITWTQTTDYGFPTFDGVNDTVISGLDSASVTLTAASGARLVDGLIIHGAPSGHGPAAALYVLDQTVITDNRIIGGATSSVKSNGSIGLRLDGAAEVAHNEILGGSGKTSDYDSFGSVAVLVLAPLGAAPHIHENRIHGGSGFNSGAAGDGSGGVVVWGAAALTGAGVAAVENNQINAGTGTRSDEHDSGTVGLWAGRAATNVDIIGNLIDAGSSTSGGTLGAGAGNAGAILMARNRIHGGTGHGTVGTLLYKSGPSELVNNMIYSGDSTSGYISDGITVNSNAVRIEQNTIVTGLAKEDYGAGIFLRNQPVRAVIENNIFAAAADANLGTVAIFSDTCAGLGVVQSLRNNVTMSATPWVYGTPPAGGCAGGSFASARDLEAALTSQCTSATAGECAAFRGAVASGNISLAASCAGNPSCVVVAGCTSQLDCLRTLFSSWDDTSNGRRELIGDGWRLAHGAPCGVTLGGAPDLLQRPSCAVDLFGTVRTAPPSMGAAELDGTCM
jgi:hypothetical protein